MKTGKNQILYGKNPALECLKASRRPVFEIYLQDTLFKSLQSELIPFLSPSFKAFHSVNKTKLDSLTQGALHQGIVFSVGTYPYADEGDIIERGDKPSTLVLCDSLQDPQNLGAISRSALCFGVDALVCPKDRAVEVTPAAVKASAGALEHLAVCRITNLINFMKDLKDAGYWCYGADIKGKKTLSQIEFPQKTALVLGSEGEGMRRLTAENCDELFKIPMAQGFDSLNVAQAASVIFYERFSRSTGHGNRES
ncbi:23S rRNA (guanosine(2251)-2'-O)-methyltransferase RlmB [bacterium]|nr:23S rRNA (guanosine(2251)-2'-O)-methyltransferase RlmB [bacterium]